MKKSLRFACTIAAIIRFASYAICAHLSPRGTRKAECRSQMQMLEMAFVSYRFDHGGCFPPPYVTDEEGRPMHSWRVLILPYLGENALYKQYDFSEPWNGPNNSKLADQMPGIFHCPGSGRYDSFPSYMMVVGPGCAPGMTHLPPVVSGPAQDTSQIPDAPGSTLLLIEVANNTVNWLEPVDFPIENFDLGIAADRPSKELRRAGHHANSRGWFAKRFTIALFWDGNVCSLDAATPPEVLKAMATIDGGEEIEVVDDDMMFPKFRLKKK